MTILSAGLFIRIYIYLMYKREIAWFDALFLKITDKMKKTMFNLDTYTRIYNIILHFKSIKD